MRQFAPELLVTAKTQRWAPEELPQTLIDAAPDYLASLEWITARENLCLAGPAGTGKSHVLVALGHAAVAAGHKVRYGLAGSITRSPRSCASARPHPAPPQSRCQGRCSGCWPLSGYCAGSSTASGWSTASLPACAGRRSRSRSPAPRCVR